MNRIQIPLTFLLLIFSLVTAGQDIRFALSNSIPVLGADGPLANPWSGGLNAPQFSKMDADQDGTEDLVVFDRSTQKLSVFLATPNGTAASFRHAPWLEPLFPKMQYWMLLVDYDGDGRKEIFTWTDGGIKVYRQKPEANPLAWEVTTELVMTEGFSGPVNLYVPASDIPAITDADNDGDLDLLVADQTGHSIEYHQNQSMEKYGHRRSLEFKRIEQCWGKIGLPETCGEVLLDQDCGTHGGRLRFNPGGRVKHTGAALLALDLDGNTLKDLLLAKVSCDQLLRLNNTGTTAHAHITRYSATFPESKPVDLNAFPAAFSEDVDGDGQKDLLVAPNVSLNEGNRIDFRQSAWLYRNTGTHDNPIFSYQQPDFLQNTTIDVGEGAFPALADYDADGDLDLFVGHRGNPATDGKLAGTLYLYKNTGTSQVPSFQFETDDFLNLSSLKATDLKPLFADVNRDGSPDLVLMNTFQGVEMDLKYWLNGASRRQPFQFAATDYKTIEVSLRPGDNPFLHDVDGDGDLDLLVGKNFGELFYYTNTGNANNPAFTLQTEAFAGFPRNSDEYNVAPLLLDLNGNGKPELLTGNRTGTIRILSDVTTAPDASYPETTEIILDSLSQQMSSPQLGRYLTLAAGDLTGDGRPELIAGSGGGGLVYLKNISTGVVFPTEPEEFTLYPIPANQSVYIQSQWDGKIEFFNALGQQLGEYTRVTAGEKLEIKVQNWPSGVYLARIHTQKGSQTKRFMVFR